MGVRSTQSAWLRVRNDVSSSRRNPQIGERSEWDITAFTSRGLRRRRCSVDGKKSSLRFNGFMSFRFTDKRFKSFLAVHTASARGCTRLLHASNIYLRSLFFKV